MTARGFETPSMRGEARLKAASVRALVQAATDSAPNPHSRDYAKRLQRAGSTRTAWRPQILITTPARARRLRVQSLLRHVI